MTRFRINIASGMLTSATSLGIQLILIPIALKTIGPTNYGLWSTLSILTIFGTLANQGLADALTRSIAFKTKEGGSKYKIANEYLSATILIGVVSAIIMAVILFSFSSQLVSILNIEQPLQSLSISLARGLSIIPGLIILDNIFAAYATGLGRYDLANYAKLAAHAIRLIATLFALWTIRSPWAMYIGIVAMYSTSLIFLFIVCVQITKGGIRFSIQGAYSKSSEVLKFSGNIFAAKTLNLTFDPLIRIVISRHIGLAEVGYFNISLQFVYAFQNIIRSGLIAYLPFASEKLNSDKNATSAMRMRSSKLAKVSLLIMTLSYIGFLVIGEAAIKFWIGDSYNPLILVGFKILFLGYIINTSAYPFVASYTALGRSKYVLFNYISMATILWLLVFLSTSTTEPSYTNILWSYTISIIVASLHAYILYTKAIAAYDRKIF